MRFGIASFTKYYLVLWAQFDEAWRPSIEAEFFRPALATSKPYVHPVVSKSMNTQRLLESHRGAGEIRLLSIGHLLVLRGVDPVRGDLLAARHVHTRLPIHCASIDQFES